MNVDLLLDAERRNEVIRHNEQEKENRVILRQFVYSVCSLANQEFPFRAHDGPSTSLNKGNFMEILNVLKIMANFLIII
jgi:hypothetical protein